jgi:hypothetical protein
MRRSFVQVDGKLYEKGVDIIPESAGGRGPSILPDLPDFVSPIDGTVVKGRKGMRDHCARHDVVPTADLKGLPPKLAVSEYAPSAAERQETKNYLSHLIDKHRR